MKIKNRIHKTAGGSPGYGYGYRCLGATRPGGGSAGGLFMAAYVC